MEGLQLINHLITCIWSPGRHFEEEPVELSGADEVFLWLHMNGKAGKD